MHFWVTGCMQQAYYDLQVICFAYFTSKPCAARLLFPCNRQTLLNVQRTLYWAWRLLSNACFQVRIEMLWSRPAPAGNIHCSGRPLPSYPTRRRGSLVNRSGSLSVSLRSNATNFVSSVRSGGQQLLVHPVHAFDWHLFPKNSF